MKTHHAAIIGAVIVFGIGTLFLLKDGPLRPNESVTVATGSPSSAAAPISNDMRAYRNTKYRFSLLYPQDLVVDTREEGGGAATVMFQNPKTGRGFQVFVMPYTEPQVTEERFKKDVPSGVRTSLTNIIIDGAVGAAFYSRHDLLGETREIWLIHKGFLYEITTLKPLDTWLDSIMGTWKFT